jgi:hypothetical protein
VIRRALSLLAMAGICVVMQRTLRNAAHPGKAVMPDAQWANAGGSQLRILVLTYVKAAAHTLYTRLRHGKKLRRSASFPDIRVLIISGLPEKQYVRNVLRAGANVDRSIAKEGELIAGTLTCFKRSTGCCSRAKPKSSSELRKARLRQQLP